MTRLDSLEYRSRGIGSRTPECTSSRFKTSERRSSNGKLVKIVSGMIPAAIATVELLLNDPGAQAANGSESLWLQLPVTHVDDFRVFSWVFEGRGVADNEEVIAIYMPASGLFSGRKARFSVAISPKGTLRSTFAVVQRGEAEPDTEPIWMHAARMPFAPAKA